MPPLTSTAMAPDRSLAQPHPQNGAARRDGERAVVGVAWHLEQTRAYREVIGTLLMWQHRLARPVRAADYGCAPAGLTPIESRLLDALCPPGRLVPRDELYARVWTDMAVAGVGEAERQMVRVHISRLAAKVERAGWHVTLASTAVEYALLRPGEAPPAGYAVNGSMHGRRHRLNRGVDCPECRAPKPAGVPAPAPGDGPIADVLARADAGAEGFDRFMATVAGPRSPGQDVAP